VPLPREQGQEDGVVDVAAQQATQRRAFALAGVMVLDVPT
jgi:hypothetical protein